MTPVKRGSNAKPNPMQDRLLAVAELVAPTAQKPTLAYLERLAGLKPGSLKESVRRGSMSKPVAAALLAAAPRLGIGGLTADWLHYARGAAPYKGGITPPSEPGRQVYRDNPTSGVSDRVAESGAPPGFDLVEEITHYPEQFARRMETTASQIGAELTVAFIDDAEKILRQNGLDFTAFFTALRARLRPQRPAAGSASA